MGEPNKQTVQQRWLRASQSRWNLGHGEWDNSKQERGLRTIKKEWLNVCRGVAWQSARHGLLALVVVQLIGFNAWAWHENTWFAHDFRAIPAENLTDMLKSSRVQVHAHIEPAYWKKT